MITAESKREHAYRILRTIPLRRRKVLCQIARRENRWPHVDWDLVEKGGPVPPEPPPPEPAKPKPWGTRYNRMSDALAQNPQAPFCSICDELVPNVSKDAVACVCSTCTYRMAERARKSGWKPKKPPRTCPDCGGPRQYRQRFCQRCASLRRRKAHRESYRHQGSGPSDS